MSTHHDLDIKPTPEEVLYVNEVELADSYQRSYGRLDYTAIKDNVRIYIPLDINEDAILKRLSQTEYRFGYLEERNEHHYYCDFCAVLSQLEIYDQVWFAREGKFADTGHSEKGRNLATRIVLVLSAWANNCNSECFPFDEIEELRKEYNLKSLEG